MILFFDTETTGLADFDKRASDPSQPHIVQLATLLCDESGETVESYNHMVAPDGWTIPPEMTAIHGISQEKAMAEGISEMTVASILWSLIGRQNLLVGHNLMFDKFIARIAMRRYKLLTDDKDEWWKTLPGFCTMRETTDLCALPGGRYGRNKFPKLEEAYSILLNRQMEKTHDAMADVMACKEIYFHLKPKTLCA